MDYSKILIANTGEDSLLLRDCEKNREIKKIYLSKLLSESKNYRPSDMDIDQEGFLYLVNSNGDSIMKIDLDNEVLLDWMKVGRCPTCIKVFDGKIYVVNSDSNSISIIDEKDFTLIEDISLGERPVDMKIDSESWKIFIANINSYGINVLDLKNDDISYINLDKQPVKIAIENKRLFILSYLNNGAVNYSDLSELELEGNKTVMSIKLKGIFTDLIKIRGKEVFYMLNIDEGYLYRLFIDEKVNISKTYLGGMPSNIIWDGKDRLYITNSLNNSLTIVEESNQRVICNIRVGEEPNKILLL